MRWFAPLVGKNLIALGLLMFGHVGYQLWGTGIEYARAQNRAESHFEELVAAAETRQQPSTTTPPMTILPTTTLPTTTNPESTASSAAETPTTVASTTTTTTTTLAPTISSAVPVYDIASLGINDGDFIAQLEIPSIGIDPYVVAGVTRQDLQHGPGHYHGPDEGNADAHVLPPGVLRIAAVRRVRRI